MTQRQDSDNLAQTGGQHSAQTPGSASNIAQYFRGVDFPCGKQELLRHVQQNGAPSDVTQTIQGLPENQRFGSMAAWRGSNR